MAKSKNSKAPHLHVVDEGPSPTIKRPTEPARPSIDPFEDLEKAAYVVHPEVEAAQAKRQRVPRNEEEFAIILIPPSSPPAPEASGQSRSVPRCGCIARSRSSRRT